MKVSPRSPSQRGLTITELLVSLAIVGVLVALLFPGYRRMVAQGKETLCLGNLRQYGAAATVFITDNRGLPRWDGLGQSQATEGSTYPAWEAWLRPYLHKTQTQRLRCPNIPAAYRAPKADKHCFNYSGNTALCIYYPSLRNLPVPSHRVVLAAESYGYDGFNHSVHFNMTMWGLTESQASGANGDFSGQQSPKAQYHGDPANRALNLFFLDGHAATVRVPQGKDWRDEPLYGTLNNTGYFFERRQFRSLAENGSTP